MANNGMINPMMQQSMQSYLLGPDILQKQYQLQQNQRYADMLMGQAQEPLNGQMVGDHYVGASPVQGLANMLKAYTSRKMMDEMPSQQYELAGMQNQRVNDMFGVGGGNVSANQASTMALGGGAMQGSVGPTNANAARMNGVQSGTAPAMPIPPGMNPRYAAQLYAISPEKFAEALVSYGKPTDLMQNSNWMGRSPQEVLAAQRGKDAADAFIRPTLVGPGNLVLDANNRPILATPDSNGKVATIGPNGVVGMGVAPGAPEAISTTTRAEQNAKNESAAENEQVTVDLPGKGSFTMTRAQWKQLVNPQGSAPAGGSPSGYNPRQQATVTTESNGNPNAVSPKGARGEFQVMPNTNRDPGFGVTPARDNSPEELNRVGVDYLEAMDKRYGNPMLGSIAYNMGPGATDKWLAAGGDFHKLPAETQMYLAKVQALTGVNLYNQNKPQASGNKSGIPGIRVQGKEEEQANITGDKMAYETLFTNRGIAQQSANAIQNINEMRGAVSRGAFQGTGATIGFELAKAINSLIPGVTVDPKRVGETGYLKSLAGESVVENLKKMGTAPTDRDMIELKEIMGGIETDPQTFSKLLDWREKVARRGIEQHNTMVDDAIKNGLKPKIKLHVEMPASNNDDLDDLLNKWKTK